MPVDQSILMEYASRAPLRKSSELVEAARVSKKQTAFLCHSHHDAPLAKGIQGFLQKEGWEVYIDWDDATMPPSPDRVTALKIQQRIRELDWFLFLATKNSVASRWCPWEIGFADGVKKTDSIVVIPTRDSGGNSHGNEYLQLYRRVDDAQGGGFGVFRPNSNGIVLSAMSL